MGFDGWDGTGWNGMDGMGRIGLDWIGWDEDDKDKGIEMENDFDGNLEDVPEDVLEEHSGQIKRNIKPNQGTPLSF